ncbi:hypothetical protein TRVA0_021S00364 [Trichomonascus vanleenenianus]|uniref:uncharacterized protein n=1 Tax=Trichomonascus vanleenenianus TaxID=2268995 RepID=UPI003ECAC363
MSFNDKPESFPLQLLQDITLRSHSPPNLMESYTRLHDLTRVDLTRVGHGRVNLNDFPKSSLDTVREIPPLPGQEGEDKIKIKLLGEIVPPEEDCQRLFMAEITSTHVPQMDGDANGMKVVAELFDPLIFYGREASVQSDLTYISSVTAYKLLKDLQGKLIPRYYGSYTMKVPVNNNSNHSDRDVRVILREYIEGTGLNKIDPKSFNREERQHLMEKIIEIEQEFDNKGIGIRLDYTPRSVILVNKTNMQMVIWSLGLAKFGPDLEQPTSQEKNIMPGALASPLLKWSNLKLRTSQFDVFVDWDWIEWLKEKYDSAPSINGTTEEYHPVMQPGRSQSSTSRNSHSVCSKSSSKSNVSKERNGKRGTEELQTSKDERRKKIKRA